MSERQDERMSSNENQGQENSNVEHLASGVQNVTLNQYDVIDSNVEEYFYMLKNSLKALDTANEMGVRSQLRNLETIENASKKLSTLNSMNLENAITEVATAIEARQKVLAQAERVTQTNQQPLTGEPQQDVPMIPVEDMSEQSLKDTSGQLTMRARQQLTTYNQQGLIEKSVRNNNPKFPLHRIFLKPNKVRQQLTRDQCTYLLQRISSEDKNNDGAKNLPVFNPDFHFQWSIFQVDHQYPIFDGFTEVHQASYLAMEANKGLSLDILEAKFAFEMQCRYIRVAFDLKMNIEMNERIAFIMANDRPIKRDDPRPCTRALLPRDGNTGAWDGQYIYFYCDDISAFTFTYNRLKNQLSPILTGGTFQLQIIAPASRNSQIKSLPQMIDLPPPSKYELLLPISCSWMPLVKSQLVDSLQERFSPIIGFGSVYIPNFAKEKGEGVSGKFIHQMARFQNDIDKIDDTKLYYWNIQQGQWIECNDNLDSTEMLCYQAHDIPTQDLQLFHFEQDKIFSNQKCDFEQPRIFGSNHYWTMYQRDQRHTQITRLPMTIHGEFSYGFNPYLPNYKDDLKVSNLLFAHCTGLNDAQKNVVFRRYVDQECQNSLEMSLRYRRTQQIMGFKSPNLTWNKPQGVQMSYRLPTLLEFLYLQLPQISLDFMRQSPIQRFHWLPKPVAAHVDDVTDTYYRSKKELNEIRSARARPTIQRGMNSQRTSLNSQPPLFNGKRKKSRK